MNYKEKLKIDLEKTIDAYHSPIINIDDVKSKLTFNTNPIEEPVKSKPKRKVLFPIWMCASLLVGIGVGTGITYAVSRNSSKNEFESSFLVGQIFDQKSSVFSELNRNVFDECTAFMTTHLTKQYSYAKLIDDSNKNTIETILVKNEDEFSTQKSDSIDLVYSNFVICSKDNSDYFYFMGYKEKEIVRYRVKSNLPYTTNQLKESFETATNSVLSKEFLNGVDTGIFANLNYDNSTKTYNLVYELNYENETYIAKYDNTLEKPVVKKLV